MEALAGEAPILGLEPSCLMTLRDEFGSLLPGKQADALKDRARLLTEYLTEHKVEAPMALPGRDAARPRPIATRKASAPSRPLSRPCGRSMARR